MLSSNLYAKQLYWFVFELLFLFCVFKCLDWQFTVIYSLFMPELLVSSLMTLNLSVSLWVVCLAYISVSPSVSCPISIFVFVYVGLGRRPISSRAWQRPEHSPSLDMPTSKHFCSRQYWQRLRVTLFIWQFLSRWQVYTMFF